jgi:D-serine deaminase-like pyridoxal phosphate-dependent protein
VARRQLELGARGITCQKLGEAEVMADAGVDDILVPYNILGAEKLVDWARSQAGAADRQRRRRGAAGRARGAVDGPDELDVLVDCDTGLGRTGVRTPEQASLHASARCRDGLRFAGFLTYPAPSGAVAFLTAAAERAARGGLEAEVVSAGGTPGMWASGELRPTVTEYRAGTYAFHDRSTDAAGAASIDDVARTVHTTVVSRPAAERAVLRRWNRTAGKVASPG